MKAIKIIIFTLVFVFTAVFAAACTDGDDTSNTSSLFYESSDSSVESFESSVAPVIPDLSDIVSQIFPDNSTVSDTSLTGDASRQ